MRVGPDPERGRIDPAGRLRARSLLPLAIMLAAVGLLVAACGGGGSDGETTSAAPAEEATTEASTAPAETATEAETAAGEQQTIAFSHPYTTNPIRIAVVEFAQDRAEELGYELLTEESNEQVDRQVAAVESWLTQGVDAMVILPMEPAAMEEYAQQAIDAGIPWIDYSVPMETYTGYVLLDHKDGGRVLGEAAANWINENLGGQAKVALLTSEACPVCVERIQGIEEALAELAPEAEIVARQDATTTEDGLAVTETLLQANPDLNVVLGMNDDGAVGAYQALVNSGRAADDAETFVGGIDSPQAALELLKECGMYRASAGLNLQEVGYAAVDAADAALNGEPAEVLLGYEALGCDDPAEIDEFLAPYSQ